MRLTKKEKKILIKELAERCKDLIFMNAEAHAEVTVEQIGDKNIDGRKTGDELVIHYNYTLCIGDILQIIGRHRRKRRLPLDKS